MKRLTHARLRGIKTGHWSPAKREELLEALANYEDTGLTPQDIYSLKARTAFQILKYVPCERCEYLVHEESENFYRCRLANGLSGELTLYDGCSRGKKKDETS